MPFKGGTRSGPGPESPEALYRDLPRRKGATPGLWTHQGDILRTYHAKHTETPDLALELPTGTGKTIPGLIIAEWVRQTRRGKRVAYACPTQQLARQVTDVAVREGVPVALLVGSHTEWPVEDRTRYVAAGAVAITTYSTVFNSDPKLPEADLLLFDDAHAGEQYVGEQYAIEIDRRKHSAAYMSVLEVCRPALDGMFVQRLLDPTPDPSARHHVRLVVPVRHDNMVPELDNRLSQLGGRHRFRHAMIRSALASCLVYVSYGRLLIRPVVPPTSENRVFSAARQRLYLSATLGNGGELERSFGRAGIKRLRLPRSAPTPRSGRRFFVFPELVKDVDPIELARDIVAAAGKALILAPDKDTAEERADELAQPGWPVMTIDDVELGMKPFADALNGTCGLASRYDGLDLPDDQCRAVVLEGRPDQNSLQERFLTERVRAGAALAERVRTRVVQGAGRCTRGPNDWAMVVVLGTDLTNYLLRPETLNALDPELQAEIHFGIGNSDKNSREDVLENVDIFFEQGDEWREDAEPRLLEHRQEAAQALPNGTKALGASVDEEIEACSYASAERWADAAQHAQFAAQKLEDGGDATQGYRAFWLYLAGVWTFRSGGTAAVRRLAARLVDEAEVAAKPATWTRELPPLPDAERGTLSPHDNTAVVAVTDRIAAGFSTATLGAYIEDMMNGLDQSDPNLYEPALTQLGKLLGADASKPQGRGRCDSTWCWENHLWFAIEAKSGQQPGGLIPHKYARQAGDQLRLLANDRGIEAAPSGSITVLVSKKPAVDPDGAKGAEFHLHLTHPDDILDVANDAKSVWADLAHHTGRMPNDLKPLVATALENRRLLPSQLRERLTKQPVAGA